MIIIPPYPQKVLKTAEKNGLIRVNGPIISKGLQAQCKKHVDISIIYTKLLITEAFLCRITIVFPRVTTKFPRVLSFLPHWTFPLYIYLYLTNYKKRKKKRHVGEGVYKNIINHGSLQLYKKPSTGFYPKNTLTRGKPVDGFLSKYNYIS